MFEAVPFVPSSAAVEAPPPVIEPPPPPPPVVAAPPAVVDSPPVVEAPPAVEAPPPTAVAAAAVAAPAKESVAASAPPEEAAEPAAPQPEVAVRGYEPERERRWTCFSLGVSLALIGLFGALPAVLEIAEYAQSDQMLPVARWAWLAILAAVVQIGYAVYAAQLPDWSTAWVVTLAGATLAAMYAALFGLTLVAGEESRIITLLELEDQLPDGRATRWCFVMLGVLGLFAYFGGRSAARWRHAFTLTRPMKERG